MGRKKRLNWEKWSPETSEPPERLQPVNWDSPNMLEIARRMGVDASENKEFLQGLARMALIANEKWPTSREMADTAFRVAFETLKLAHMLIDLLPYSITRGNIAGRAKDLEDENFKFGPGFIDGYPDPAAVITALLDLSPSFANYGKAKMIESRNDPRKPKNWPLRCAVHGLWVRLHLSMLKLGIHPAIARRKLPTLIWLALGAAEVRIPGKTPAEQKKRLREQYFPKAKGAV